MINAYNIRDGKVTRELSYHEQVFLKDDVKRHLEQWKSHFERCLAEEENEIQKAKYDGAIWAINCALRDIN